MQNLPTGPGRALVCFDESDLITALTSHAALNGLTLPAGRVTLRLRNGRPITELTLETASLTPKPRVKPSRPVPTIVRPPAAISPPLVATTDTTARSAVLQSNFS